MTPNEFVTWLKGFIQASGTFTLTPKQFDDLKDQLDKVNTDEKPLWTVSYPKDRTDVTYKTDVLTTKTI
jgi:hypothetical protein